MEMILASIALEYNLIDQRIFVALIMMALITSMISGPVLQKLVTKET
jgi:Kef-type K+ transport system membrane component KefB